MKQSRKLKQLSFVIAVILLLSMSVIACSKDSGSNKVELPSEKTSNNDVQPTSSNKAADGKVTDQPLSVRLTISEAPNQPIKADAPSFKLREELTGVKLIIEAVPASNYPDKTKILISTNNIPDIIKVTHQELVDFSSTGIFLPISDYLDQAPNFKKLIEENEQINNLMVNGKLYGFPVLARWQDVSGPLPMIRDDIMEELDLSMPETFDDLYTVLTTIKQAYPDSTPMSTRNGTDGVMEIMSYPLGSGYKLYYDYDTEGGKWLYGPSHTEFKQVLEFVNKLYTEKLLDQDYAVATRQTWMENLGSGKSMFFYDNNGFALEMTATLKEKYPNAHFNMITNMENSFGQRRNYQFPPGWMANNYAISSKVKDPEAIIRYMDWMYSEEGADVTNFASLPGENFTIENGDYITSETLIKQYEDKADPEYTMMSDLGTSLLSFTTYVDQRLTRPLKSEEYITWGNQINEMKKLGENAIVYKPLSPVLTAKEIEEAKAIQTQLDTMVTQEMDKFIMGTKPLSEYDSFMQQLVDKGAERLEEIYNTAQSRL